MASNQNRNIITFIVILVGFIIGAVLAFSDGIQIYYIGYSLLGGFFLFTILIDVFVSLPTIEKKVSPRTEISNYMGKDKNGDSPKLIKKIRERAF